MDKHINSDLDHRYNAMHGASGSKTIIDLA
jgi:hypothetical protein